ncbi:MAG TPA: DMT family transporter, partial [Candidatus Saccharimonadales bacterium]|nr:DMT family transporter [Candidatus Saccharimonadales bacterium]
MAGSAVCFSVMAALVKVAAARIPNQEIVTLRSLAALVSVSVLLRWRRVPLRIHRPGALLVRALLGYTALSCWFLAIGRLSLSDAVMIQYTSPVFVALIAPLALGEKTRPRDRAALAVALAGVVLVVRPGFGIDAGGAMIGLTGAICSATAYVLVRWLRQYEHPLIIMLAFPVVATLVGSAVAAPQWVWPEVRDWMILAGICLLTVAGQLGLTFGLVWERAGPATVATYLAVAVSIPVSIVAFGEWPDRLMILGGLMVVGSVASLALTTHKPVPPPTGAGGAQVASS